MAGLVAYDPVSTPVFFRAVVVLAVDVGLRGRLPPVLEHRVRLSDVVSSATSGCSGASTMKVAPNSVSGRVVNTVIGPAGDSKSTARRRAADPVALHRLQRVGPVQPVEVVEQAVGVGGDAHHPLAHVALEHREVAAVAAAVGGDLLVGQHRAQARAPVHRRVGDVGQPVPSITSALLGRGQLRPRAGRRLARPRLELGAQLGDRPGRPPPSGGGVVPRVEDLQEDPLRPPVVGRVGGLDRSAPVVAQPQPAQLPAEVATFSAVVIAGCWPVCTAYCSAGRPKASKPIG